MLRLEAPATTLISPTLLSVLDTGIASAQAGRKSGSGPSILQSVASGRRVIDLTHSFDDRTIYWPTEDGFQLLRGKAGVTESYSEHWPTRERYLGTKAMGPEAVKLLHFPGLDPIAAQWLVDHRAIKAVGIDTASIDYGQSRLFGSHVHLCRHNVPVFENVANLDELPTSGSTVIALPMKIAGGTGAPLRMIGIVQATRSPVTEFPSP